MLKENGSDMSTIIFVLGYIDLNHFPISNKENGVTQIITVSYLFFSNNELILFLYNHNHIIKPSGSKIRFAIEYDTWNNQFDSLASLDLPLVTPCRHVNVSIESQILNGNDSDKLATS